MLCHAKPFLAVLKIATSEVIACLFSKQICKTIVDLAIWRNIMRKTTGTSKMDFIFLYLAPAAVWLCVTLTNGDFITLNILTLHSS